MVAIYRRDAIIKLMVLNHRELLNLKMVFSVVFVLIYLDAFEMCIFSNAIPEIDSGSNVLNIALFCR